MSSDIICEFLSVGCSEDQIAACIEHVVSNTGLAWDGLSGDDKIEVLRRVVHRRTAASAIKPWKGPVPKVNDDANGDVDMMDDSDGGGDHGTKEKIEGGAVTFTFLNRCTGTVWPGILSNAGTARIEPTGFALPPGAARALPFPTGWSGRLWARTGCAQDAAGRFACATGDCGTGTLECAGRDGATPATLAEFTLDGGGHNDFYDVSLVDGYNLPILVEPAGSSATGTTCAAAGCSADLNLRCPAELRSAGGGACRSACDAFGKPEYCCSGAFANPNTCHPTAYSQAFKLACPRSYSYAFDDPTSTFTCAGGRDYTITFCPVATPRSTTRLNHCINSLAKACFRVTFRSCAVNHTMICTHC
ncbi:thaumatin-like protein 1b [Hordeum vulgare]|nr:thaumatin-like protein 1b [Hordeum vulgare]